MQKIRELAVKYTHKELEACIDQQIKEGSNACFMGATTEETMNTLSKASYINRLIDSGKARDVVDGLRQLAASMRSIQPGK